MNPVQIKHFATEIRKVSSQSFEINVRHQSVKETLFQNGK